MSEIRATLDKNIEAWNKSEDVTEKITLKGDIKDAVQAYNELSMLTVYADCLNSEQPMLAFIKAYYYPIIRLKETLVKDKDSEGRLTAYMSLSITETDNKGNLLYSNLDMVKFLDWTADRNKLAANAKDWKCKLLKARNSIIADIEKHKNSKDGKAISKANTKRAFQDSFDALIFIPCEKAKDKNAVIASGKLIEDAPFLSAQMIEKCVNGSPDFEVKYFTADYWYKTVFKYLHMAVEGKDLKVTLYDDAEETAEETAPEADAKK